MRSRSFNSSLQRAVVRLIRSDSSGTPFLARRLYFAARLDGARRTRKEFDMAVTHRIGLRTRALLGAGAALLASPLGFGSVVVGHATTAWACTVDVSWTTHNTAGAGVQTGTMFVTPLNPVDCLVATTSPLGVNQTDPLTYEVDYTYSGDCAEGTLAFSNGTVGVFAAGTLTAEQQSSAGVGTVVAVGLPLGTPCTGGTLIWGGPGTEAGG
jgi:hypothetical protein